MPWITRGIRRDYPGATWVHLESRREVETRMLDAGGGVAVKVQIARWRDGWRVLPVAAAPVKLRYSDLPPEVSLVVPTPAAFVTMKLAAWSDRHAPRDLFDLWELARGGHFTPEVPELFRQLTDSTPSPATLGRGIPPLTTDSWIAELGQQTGDLPDPSTCMRVVLEALGRLSSSGR